MDGISDKDKALHKHVACEGLVRLKGFEPPTYWFVASHSIQLSYSRVSQRICIIVRKPGSVKHKFSEFEKIKKKRRTGAESFVCPSGRALALPEDSRDKKEREERGGVLSFVS